MQPLYDFGISQEDPLTELDVLSINEKDHLLCVASGGEVPLSILSLRPGIHITAVDISKSQLMLCELKRQAAIHLPFPLNGQFLGYADLPQSDRFQIYSKQIAPYLPEDHREFWLDNYEVILEGVVNNGRFEQYIKRLREVASILIGKKNIDALLHSGDLEEQAEIFDQRIGSRKALRLFFRIAFHPSIYKKRGLDSKALMHARSNIGEMFFNKFRSFCTATPASKNYFLQYFLRGNCNETKAFPEYLQEQNLSNLINNQEQLSFSQSSLQTELNLHQPSTFTKIHLSNIGDWMSADEFENLLIILQRTCNDQTSLCYRFLQKNHLENLATGSSHFTINELNFEQRDRFPFYSILSMNCHG
jgi:S-adenosylmethionine-diacylglycerol 3-amino-3-carboxypropyl transferase